VGPETLAAVKIEDDRGAVRSVPEDLETLVDLRVAVVDRAAIVRHEVVDDLRAGEVADERRTSLDDRRAAVVAPRERKHSDNKNPCP
jgi:hypothetical protein